MANMAPENSNPIETERSATQERKPDRREIKAAKKEEKRLRREKRRDAYKALPPGKKALRWLIWSAVGLTAAALLYYAGIYVYSACMQSYVDKRYQQSLAAVAPYEEILRYAPEDTEGAERVAATKPFRADGTWAVYMYVCGSNLESMGRNQLSDTTAYFVDMEKNANDYQRSEETQQRFHTFIDEMQQQGMSLPSYLFLPTRHGGGEEYESGEESTEEGFATKNLRDMFAVELPENVSVIIETGGANDWSLSQVNPNASQRFLYDHNGLTELTSTYPQNMGSGQTFSEFLRFCQTEHPADHQMLVIWNHGAGPFGFCNDEIFDNDGITLSEMKDAFAAVYGSAPAAPPFELIGFDACLMASTEVAEALHGYARYLAASEETEMGDGWRYKEWLTELASHPEMNGAQIGRVIADSFVESCANFSINMQWLNFEAVGTFSVIDVEKAHGVYKAYTELCATALENTASDPWPLVAWGRAAEKSIRYAGSAYKYFNTIDMGSFMQNLSDEFPDGTRAVLAALDAAVLYHRETSYTQGSEGLSIYFPTNVDSLYGLLYYLEYMDTVCTDPDMKALYYYKIAGCLNEELQAYTDEAGYGTFAVLDTAPLQQLSAREPAIGEDYSIELTLDNAAAALMQDVALSIAELNTNTDELYFYGEDAYTYLDGDLTICTTFGGWWAMLDGNALPLEIIDHTDAFIRYRCPIRYQDRENSYLVIAYDLSDDSFSILGVSAMDEEADTLGRNLEPVEIGSRIAIKYRIESLSDESIRTQYGDSFIFRANSKVEQAPLADGQYYVALDITDIRGDSYYPALIAFSMEDGVITDMSVTEEYSAMMSAE